MMIVKRLREIQNRYGYLPDRELAQLARLVGVPMYRIEEVASFFPAFRQERDKPAALEVRVCRDVTCHHRGAAALLDPKSGLPALADDPSVQADLVANAPAWAAEARATPGGRRIELPTPTPDRCRLVVEGVSCLGRCDRAPAVWVERHPMPVEDHHHAWVFARKAGETAAAYRSRLETTVRTIAGGGHVEPDSDETYEPATNAEYGVPALPPDPRARSLAEFELPDELPSPRWEIDCYATAGHPRDYRAVRAVADWLAARPETARQLRDGEQPVPEPPDGLGGDKLKEWIRANHPFLAEMAASNLLGMGGAGEPAYDKWAQLLVARGKGPDKYIVCNADESEPGTFKDRELLLRTPHLVVEGLILAGLLTGATAGYVYIRHEYHEQIHAVETEMKRAERLGACGPDVFGSGIGFRAEVFESPGGYICGEQSALIEAMEDKRGQPRQRPPELQTNGLWDQPTVVNNVETLGWAPFILTRKGKAYGELGYKVPDSAAAFGGRRLFSISGDVKRPGVYEVPIGIPLGEVFEDKKYCGGFPNGLYAVAPSGPSSGIVPANIPIAPVPAAGEYEAWLAKVLGGFRSPAEKAAMERVARAHLKPGATTLDIRALPMDLNFFRGVNGALKLKVGIALGAAIVVYGNGTDALAQAVNYTRFFRNESCGKCVPCRLGSQKLYQIGLDLLGRKAGGPALTGSDLKHAGEDVKALTEAMAQTSICGLGPSAPVPLACALEYFLLPALPPKAAAPAAAGS
jgi:NADH:ubiquinone oxidoreductase subunit F (NADH-binding)/NADH:ubiquinone oxidoreductase subunit E